MAVFIHYDLSIVGNTDPDTKIWQVVCSKRAPAMNA